jgi:hypothetical protein
MARRTPRKPDSTIKSRPTIGDLIRADVAVKIEKARRARTARRKSERIPRELERPATKAQRDELRAHGFRTTKRGVVVDGPRNKISRPIKGARVRVLSGGVVQTSVKQRRDYIYGFTKAEKREFAKNPGAFEQKKLAELEKRFPYLARFRRKRQIRLQWGAYRATKDFAPSYFTATYFATVAPETLRKKGKKGARPRIDNLTGFHIVIHVPQPGKKNAAKTKGRKKKK